MLQTDRQTDDILWHHRTVKLGRQNVAVLPRAFIRSFTVYFSPSFTVHCVFIVFIFLLFSPFDYYSIQL